MTFGVQPARSEPRMMHFARGRLHDQQFAMTSALLALPLLSPEAATAYVTPCGDSTIFLPVAEGSRAGLKASIGADVRCASRSREAACNVAKVRSAGASSTGAAAATTTCSTTGRGCCRCCCKSVRLGTGVVVVDTGKDSVG